MKSITMLLDHFEVNAADNLKNSGKFKALVREVEIKNRVQIAGYRTNKDGGLFLYTDFSFHEFSISYGNGLKLVRFGIIHSLKN